MNNSPHIDFSLLEAQLIALLENEPDKLAGSAIFVGLLYDALPEINWLGLYVVRDNELVLGPFQGKPACIRISIGQGVCGSAVLQSNTLRIDDVEKFDGHIVCDVASKSEIVVPLYLKDRVVAVLDVDSPIRERFSTKDQQGLERLCRTFQSLVIETAAAPTTRDRPFI